MAIYEKMINEAVGATKQSFLLSRRKEAETSN